MMQPRSTWLVFACIAVALVAAMGWVTHLMLRTDAVNREIQEDMATQSLARLALWRLDSAALPLLTEAGDNPQVAGEIAKVPRQAFVIHMTGDLEFNSPRETEPTLAAGVVDAMRILTREAATDPAPAQTSADRQVATNQQPSLGGFNPQQSVVNEAYQSRANVEDYQSRSQQTQQLQMNQRMTAEPTAMRRAIVVDEKLVVAWRKQRGEYFWHEGFLLDWSPLRRLLLAQVKDLLPDAKLKLLSSAEAETSAHRMSVLPVVLEPGRVVMPVSLDSPVRWSLATAWTGVVLGLIAMAMLLAGVMRLSARRSAFVHAVTHEMRTPLTTFRLYADLLSQGKVPDESRQQKYHDTLSREAERLSQMVENVLMHARLERSPAKMDGEVQPLGEAVDRAWDRLVCRVNQSGMVLKREEETAGIAAMRVRVEQGSLEQILLNLVDNACKHGHATDPTIHIRLVEHEGKGAIAVRDHGQGVSPGLRRRLFTPFHRDEQQAATPGIGLGLAISRQLARRMCGDLSLDKTCREGTCFILTLGRE